MEHVGWLRKVSDLHVAILVLTVELVRGWEYAWIFVAELEIPFHTSGGVLRTLTIVTMGQAHDQTGSLQPLHFTRSDELVNNALSVVGKVTELRFPDDKCIG